MSHCPNCGKEIPAGANFCPGCGNPAPKPEAAKPITDAEKRKLQEAAVDLVHSATSLVSGTSKLVAALGEIIETRATASKGERSKELDEALTKLGAAVRSAGDAVDELCRKAAEKVEDKIRRK
ncbi:MAG: zinc-ribbon domain-containing protein [Candidatus Bathyarchaeia archaeon]